MQNLMGGSTFFMTDNNKDEELVLITEPLEVLCLKVDDKHVCLVDCACPTTVAGLGWMEEYIRSIPEDQKNQIKFEKSERMYKFGGGEKESLCLLSSSDAFSEVNR